MASSGPNPESSPVWFCHECNRETQPLRLPDPHCRHCHSTFIEELSSHVSLEDHPRHWTSNETRIPPDPDRQTYPSPPLPSTRQRYDEQERQAGLQPNFPEMLGPLVSLFGLQNFVPNANPASERADTAEPGNRPPPSTANRPASVPRWGQPNPPETGGQGSNRPTRPTGPSNEANNAPGRPAGVNPENTGDSRAIPGTFTTFTFNAPPRVNPPQTQETRPPPANFFTFLQAAMGQFPQRPNPPPTNTQAGEEEDDDDMPALVDIEPQPRWTDDGDHLHNPDPHPRSDGAGGVNLEEGHPLREFISFITSIAPSDNNGFAFGAGVGGAQFGFATGGGAQFGDYVFNETGMQDVMTHLMNMAGGGAMGPQPVPASEAKIRSLKRFKIDLNDLDGEPGECAICKESYVAQDECLELPCKHVFHAQDCIIPWLKQNGTCPVCRFALVDEPSDDPQDVPAGQQGSSSDSHTAQASGGTHQPRSMAELAAEAAERRSRNIYGDVPDLDID